MVAEHLSTPDHNNNGVVSSLKKLWAVLVQKSPSSLAASHARSQWTLFQWGSKVSTNWSNKWKHACYCAFMYTFTEKHVCFHVISLFSAHF